MITASAFAEPTKRIFLILNAGSSSLKFTLFRGEAEPVPILSGAIERIGLPEATFTLKRGVGHETERVRVSAPDHVTGLGYLLKHLKETMGEAGFHSIGHRVVHGGTRYLEPQVVTQEMIEELRQLCLFAPAHLPAEIDIIAALSERFPNLPQVACFDTAFHRTMPRVASLLPIPRRYEAAGVRRYGFHGLSYEFLMEELVCLGDQAATTGRVILAHLGNGASLAAVRDGKSIDTSMGFTPAAGLVMGTRPGDLDPGLISFLWRRDQMAASQFDQMIHHESGLLGVSEISSDMRDLLARESGDVRAAEAVALFCNQAKKWIGSFTAALGGLDTLVFAGGIGENAPLIRARICDELGFLGIELNEGRNSENASLISTDCGRVAVRVIRTDEELMIVRYVIRVLSHGGAQKHS